MGRLVGEESTDLVQGRDTYGERIVWGIVVYPKISIILAVEWRIAREDNLWVIIESELATRAVAPNVGRKLAFATFAPERRLAF